MSKNKEQQEPVAWLDPEGDEYCNIITDAWKKRLHTHTTRLEKEHEAKHTVPVYTSPPQRPWVGLTDEEIEKEWVKMCGSQSWARHKVYARNIEAALRSKNT